MICLSLHHLSIYRFVKRKKGVLATNNHQQLPLPLPLSPPALQLPFPATPLPASNKRKVLQCSSAPHEKNQSWPKLPPPSAFPQEFSQNKMTVPASRATQKNLHGSNYHHRPPQFPKNRQNFVLGTGMEWKIDPITLAFRECPS